MSTFFVRPEVAALKPYSAGKSIEEVRREYGLTRIIKLASNENPLGPSPRALQALREAAEGVNIYPEGPSTALREALGARWGVGPDWIFVGNGSDEIFRLLATTYLRRGDRVVVPRPSFPVYAGASALMGAQVDAVPLKDGAMDLPAMAARARGARIVFLCRPNNPTGGVFAAEAFDAFLRAVDPDTLVVLDEAYREYDDTLFDSRAFLAEYPNLIVTRTFSKIYGLAGLRLGYGVGRPGIWQPLYTVREPFSVNRLAQAAGLAALDDHDHLEASRRMNQAGRQFLTAFFREMGLRPWPTQANFVLVDLGRPAAPVFEGLLRRGVVVRLPDPADLPNALRVTVGTEEQNREFVRALTDVLNA
ncbi:histidinol-phosphate transaminase [Caldinitratiruptor microaerophilus]|uniref:Histidinol-phosphate aminotransferase n=1 Tax=Caldinitratiruptor microaerophilus TaxID=671077 RepID=A0AA35G8Q1_9FIRM|nr:histidinol-phosphate transaminase [Caldinitratiruptor microaerophilus]BDG61265.1 histidinol-phosphate aminotransferase [Caldinitratiruptor microaerophilus]